MAYRIEFSDVAKAETDAAYLYLSQRSRSLEVAIRWLRGLEEALDRLAEQLEGLPGRRPLAPENDLFPDVEVYQLLYGRGAGAYRVLYILTDSGDDDAQDTIRVLHVQGRLLVTTDKGFAPHRSEPHAGILIILLRQPNAAKIYQRVLTALAQFAPDEWAGLLVVMRDTVQSVWRADTAAGAGV
jgi:plasmid stabilization system protein ParE